MQQDQSLSDNTPQQFVYKDAINGVTMIAQRSPVSLRRAAEDVALFSRHISPIKFEVTYEPVQTPCRSVAYEPNPFDATQKEQRYEQGYAPDFGLPFVWDNQEREYEYAMDTYHYVAVQMYQLCLSNNDHKSYKVVGSICHDGFVNHLFDHYHRGHMPAIRSWIETIGQQYDPSKLKTIHLPRFDDYVGVYAQNLYCCDVIKLCEYCEIMFGVSKYDVAPMFERESLDAVIQSCKTDKQDELSPSALYRLARICAENDDYQGALLYCQRYNAIAAHPGLATDAQSLIKYHQENGTTRLWTS